MLMGLCLLLEFPHTKANDGALRGPNYQCDEIEFLVLQLMRAYKYSSREMMNSVKCQVVSSIFLFRLITEKTRPQDLVHVYY